MPTRQKILLGVLGILVAYYVLTVIMPPAKIPAPVPPQPAAPKASGQNVVRQPVKQPGLSGGQEPGSMVPASASSVFVSNQWGPRDPFYRHVVEVESVAALDSTKKEPDLVLKGIQWSRGEALIIINDEILRIDDSINGMRIVKVGEDYVVLQRGTDLITLRIGGKNE